MTQGQRADIVQGAADGPAHLFVHLMLDMGKAVRIGRQPVLQDGVHGFQGRLQGVPGLACETGQRGLAFLQGLPRFCLEVEAAQEEVPQGGGAETGAVGLRGRWGRRDIGGAAGAVPRSVARASTRAAMSSAPVCRASRIRARSAAMSACPASRSAMTASSRPLACNCRNSWARCGSSSRRMAMLRRTRVWSSPA